MISYKRIYATVDLDAIEDNIKAMGAHIGSDVAMMGIVKADGYGHGSIQVAKAIDAYVSSYGVATIEEGVILRKEGIEKPILILGVVHEEQYPLLFEYDFRPAVFQMEKAKILSKMAVEKEMQLAIHLALDTGMSRIGMEDNKASVAMVKEMSLLPGIQIEGLFTHFARADEKDKVWAHKQMKRYLDFLHMLEKEGLEIPIRHSANSASILDIREAHLNLVRAGIAIYGIYPSGEVSKEEIILKPAMELISCLTYVKEIEAGTQVSYGGTYTAKDTMKIGTVPVGYADGYSRNLSGRGYVLIGGKKAPVIGRVCMDQMMVDLSEIPEAAEEERVVLLGKDGDLSISVEDLAEWSGGFHYEIPCLITKRVPRVYLRNNQVESTKDYF